MSARQSLKAGITQLIWGVLAIISGLEGYVMLSDGQLLMGVADVLICVGLSALTVYWRRIVHYFESNPLILRAGVLVILLTSRHHLLAAAGLTRVSPA